MTEKERNRLLVILIVSIIIVTILYARFTYKPDMYRGLRAGGEYANWSVSFSPSLDSSITAYEYATVESDSINFSKNSTIVVLPKAILKAPGDKVVYKWNVKNSGDIDAVLSGKTDITAKNIVFKNSEQLTQSEREQLINDIEVRLTYSDGSSISIGDKLNKYSSKEIMVTIEYIKRETPQKLPSEEVMFNNITAALIYSQDFSK